MLCMILQARVKAIAEIVSELIAGVKEGRDVDLNNVKREVENNQLFAFLLANMYLASWWWHIKH